MGQSAAVLYNACEKLKKKNYIEAMSITVIFMQMWQSKNAGWIRVL